MSFLKIIVSVNCNNAIGNILLEGNIETFPLNLCEWSAKDYIQQWKHAARVALKKRRVAGIITNYECSKKDVKMMGVFTIIPKEVANPRRKWEENECEIGFYITNRFIFVSEDISNLISHHQFLKIKRSFGHYFPIYYFDRKNIELFYLYLSEASEGISRWNLSAVELRDFIADRKPIKYVSKI